MTINEYLDELLKDNPTEPEWNGIDREYARDVRQGFVEIPHSPIHIQIGRVYTADDYYEAQMRGPISENG